MKYLSFLLSGLILSQPCFSQVKFARGLEFDGDAYQNVPKKASLIRGDYEHLPDQVSLKEFCPRPGNQIQLNTSSSWAAAYGARTIMEAESLNDRDLQHVTQNSYSPVFNYLLSTKFENNNCAAPSTLTGVLESMKKYGVPKFIKFQEFCPDSIPKMVYQFAADHKITDYAKLFDINDAPEFKLEAVKKSLNEGLPVIIGMYCPPSFNLAKGFWQPREKVSEKLDAQALCIVGYDNTKYGGSFEILNSWGNGWGNNGFIWIRYADFIDFTPTAYEILIISDESNTVDFSGKIKLILDDGALMNIHLTDSNGYYQTNAVYKTGTKFKILVTNNESAYLYVFGTDQTNTFFPLFPANNTISPVLNYKNSNIALPGENLNIEITGDPGKDYLVILYSKEEIHINSLLNKLQTGKGRIDERMRNIENLPAIDKINIKWETDEINFSGISKGRTLVPVFVEIQHY